MNGKFFALLIATVFLSLIIGCSSESKTLSIKPTSIDFGEVNIGDTETDSIVLTNKYGKPITISTILLDGSPDITIQTGGATPVDLNNKETLTIVFDFAPANAGPVNSILTIGHTGSTKDKMVTITGIGRPVARIELSEPSYDFKKKLINKTHTHEIEISNKGTNDLNIDNYSFTGANPNLFTVSTGGTVPKTILAGQSHKITIEFSPTVLGMFSATLNIGHNAVNEGNPLEVAISGEGVDLDPQITLNQSSPWDFDSVATVYTKTEICEIENTGSNPLLITTATLSTNTEFTVYSLKDSNGNILSFPQSIQVGSKLFLAIKFAPNSVNSFSDTLSIYHDGTNELSPINLTLEGQGRLLITKKYSFTGAPEQLTIPAGITSINVEMYGAEGGSSSTGSYGYAGKGGKVTATLQVQPGDVLNIYVGGKGVNGSSTSGGAGGWNGGGKGETWSGGRCGGGGGGASDIRKNGTAISDRIIVGGAGGGGGNNGSSGEAGGNGGDLIAQKGNNSYGGGGGTQSAGGVGGNASGRLGKDGALGIGGAAYGGSTGGGGGAGYWGGGGGSYEAGGGGSSYTETTASNVVHVQGSRSGDGEITITY